RHRPRHHQRQWRRLRPGAPDRRLRRACAGDASGGARVAESEAGGGLALHRRGRRHRACRGARVNEKLLAHFAEQAGFCTALGSPFTGQLIERMRADIAAGGPTAALVGGWQGNPRADAVSLRLAGAAHAAVLTGRDERLAALYPHQNPGLRMDEVWPVVRDLFEREADLVREFIRSAPQTNETRRSIALLAAFLSFARDW